MALNEDYLKIGSDIIGKSFAVRNNTGIGLLESYYEKALAKELRDLGYNVARQVLVPCYYNGCLINDAYKADILVDNRVVIEVKAIRIMGETESRQILTYMRLMSFRLGYLINFGAYDFSVGKAKDEFPYKKGIYRFVNNL